MATNPTLKQRDPAEPPLIHPLVYDRIYDDPARVLAMLRRNGPYRWVGRDYIATDGAPALQWFRETWMFDDHGGDPERRLLLDNPLFFTGSRASFVGFKIVRPESVRINLMAPMPAQVGHCDLPYFRGLDHSTIPMHFLLAMGRSGLFERWMINVSSALSWLYTGLDGGLCFWPDGPDKPGSRVAPSLNNRGIISDNQRMYHYVDAFGGEGARSFALQPDSALIADGDSWALTGSGGIVHRYAPEEIRISLLWKAVMFRDEEDARIHDEHLDDISLDEAIEILREDAARRGIAIARPGDPLHDVAFTHDLERAFPTRSTFPAVTTDV